MDKKIEFPVELERYLSIKIVDRINVYMGGELLTPKNEISGGDYLITTTHILFINNSFCEIDGVVNITDHQIFRFVYCNSKWTQIF